jgi:hypothetical protein
MIDAETIPLQTQSSHQSDQSIKLDENIFEVSHQLDDTRTTKQSNVHYPRKMIIDLEQFSINCIITKVASYLIRKKQKNLHLLNKYDHS